MFIDVMIIAGIGCVVSLYSYFIERKLEKNPAYKPLCNLSDAVSCTKPIQSAYGKIFGISNALMGLVFYITIIFTAVVNASAFIWYAALAACVVSVYLAYLMIFRIQSLCMVCLSIYIINGALLLVSYRHYFGVL